MIIRFSSIFLGTLMALSSLSAHANPTAIQTTAEAKAPAASEPLVSKSLTTTAAVAPITSVTPIDANISAPASNAPVLSHQMAGMTEYRLSNGLKVVLVPDPGKPTTTVNITYHVGSRHEVYGETGMAHLLEHLLFKGTPTVPNLTHELSSRGMRPNGTTWYDRTNYFETFASSDDKLEWALKMEADRMTNAFIAKKDLDSEMTVVRNEMESGENDPQRILIQKMTALAYQWHNYGKNTIGARSDVENVSIYHLKAFYEKYYQPDNAVLVIAGLFDQTKTLKWVEQYFGSIPRPARPIPITYTEEPTQDGERAVNLQRVGNQKSVALLYRIPAATHPDFPAIEVLIEALSSSPSGRLHKALIESQKAAEVSGYAYPLQEPGHLILSAELREESSIDEVKKKFLQTVEQLNETPLTQEEIDRAKRIIVNQWNQVLRDPQKLGVALSQAIAVGDWRVLLLNRDRLEHVSLQDVQRVAEQYLKSSNRTLGTFTPTQSPIRATIPKAIAIEKQLEHFQPTTTISQGEAFDPSYENIEQRVVRFRLANGAKVAVLPKKNRGETVSLYAQLHWGDESSLKHARWKGELLGAMLRRGTERLSYKELADQLELLGAQFSISSDVDGLVIKAETTQPNMAALLMLMADMLKSPRFDRKEWDILKQQTLASLESTRSEPSGWASRELGRYHQPYAIDDPRYIATLDEEIEEVESLTLETIESFYKDLVSTQHSEWAVVGNANAEKIKTQLDELVGNLPAKTPYQRLTQTVFAAPADILAKHLPDKSNAMLEGRLLLPIEDTNPDYPALIAANTLLGGGFLNSRLATRIRQKEGISYGVGSTLKTSADDPYSEWRIYAIFAPQNRERLMKAINEELFAMQKDPINPQILQNTLQGWLEARRLARSQDDRLAASLAEWMRLGRTGHDSQDLENKVKALQPEQVKAAIEKYLKPDQWVFSLAGTFPLTEEDGAKKE
ncbi:MAG: pitrilysin family protein [Pseudomonadota bacterium]